MNNTPQSPKKKYNLRKKRRKKYVDPESDSDNDDDDSDYIPVDSDHPESEHSEEEDENFDINEWRNFLGKMFPSKYTSKRNKKLECFEKLKKGVKTQKHIEEKEDSSDDEDDDDEDDDDEDHEEDNALLRKMWEEEDAENMMEDGFLNNSNMKVNIIFTVADNDAYYEDEDEDEDEDDVEDEDEDEDECKEEKVDDNEEVDNNTKIVKKKKIIKNNKKNNYKKDDTVEIKIKNKWIQGKIIKENDDETYKVKVDQKIYSKISDKDMRHIDLDILDELKMLVESKKNSGKRGLVKKFDELVKAQEKKDAKKQKVKDKKQKNTNIKSYRKLMNSQNVMCDYKYFRNLSVRKQTIILEQMKDIKKHSQLKKPYRINLLETDMPVEYKVIAFNKINTLTNMDRASGEYYKIKQWVDTFMQIPFGKYVTLPIQMSEGKEKCQTFMEKAQQQLDGAVYGLEDAKMQIMQMMGQWISNPKSVGTAIAIHGPMGTGKTTLVKEGISKVLNRPFTFIALGGATDSSFLEGHSYTYEGSSWGKIVDILIQSKCMNPVIYFDELDKISDTPKGEEIIGILTHLTDTTQNPQYHDKYFSGIDFDLSKVLFIFSYNDDKKINPILKDRMYTIETKGYNTKEKTTIAINYLIPSIEKNVSFGKDQIIIPRETLEYIITKYTADEKGVRNLKRCLEIIYTKLNLFRLMKPDSKLFDTNMNSLTVKFPYTIQPKIVDKLIKQQKSNIPLHLYT